MNNRTGEVLRKRKLERSYFVVYCISTKINIDSDKFYTEPKKLYTFFGCTLDGKKKYLSCTLETDVEKTSEWYNFFQELKKRGMEHIVFALLPKDKGIRDAIKLGFPKVEIFTSCEGTIDKLLKYNSYKTKDEIYRQIRRIFVARDLLEYELNYKDFIEKYEKYPFIMDMLKEELKNIKNNYKYSFMVRRIIYAFNYIIEMKKRFSRYSTDEVYNNKDEFIDACAYAIFMSESSLHYYKDEWTIVLNEVYEEKNELIKPYL